jgi:hypothetical protein
LRHQDFDVCEFIVAALHPQDGPPRQSLCRDFNILVAPVPPFMAISGIKAPADLPGLKNI